jgi:hypothetical protein
MSLKLKRIPGPAAPSCELVASSENRIENLEFGFGIWNLEFGISNLKTANKNVAV